MYKVAEIIAAIGVHTGRPIDKLGMPPPVYERNLDNSPGQEQGRGETGQGPLCGLCQPPHIASKDSRP